MTPSQVAELLSFAAAFDRRTVGKADILAWHTVLTDVDYDQARDAVAAHYSDTRDWIMPADIRQRVRKHRSDQAADIQGPGLPPAIPDADPDDVPAYLAAVRQQRTRAAAGHQLKPRPVLELLAGIGRDIPRDLPVPRGPMGATCPHCDAKPRHGCRTPSGKRLVAFHPSRIDLAKEA